MNQAERITLIETLVAMGEVYGRPMTEISVKMIANDLSELPLQSCMIALERCRKELRTFPTVSEILARANALDGRPGPEEAWAMVPRREADSVVWTEEVRDAFFICYSLIENDEIAAHMAFREAYVKRVNEARESGAPVNWIHTLGQDPRSRRVVLEEAVRLGRLSLEHVQSIIPDINVKVNPEIQKMIGGMFKQLPGGGE